MSSRNISWEIILAGLAFTGFAIYLLNRHQVSNSTHAWHSSHRAIVPVPPPPPPSTIVIDLQNLENLKNLKNLKNLENLEIELKNLDKIIRQHEQKIEGSAQLSVEKSMQQLEQQLQKLGDFNIKLQDRKVYINRDFNVKEATWSEVSSGVFVYRESFDASQAKTIDLNLGFGNVNIVGRDTARGELVLQATGDVPSPEEIQKRLTMLANIRDEHISFVISSNDQFNLSDRINLEATLTLPGNINVEVKTAGGHITATHLKGDQSLTTSGGHITLDDLAGKIIAKTSGGHITCNQLEGNVTLSTSGGHIKIDEVSGKMNFSTGGGHIEIQNWTGQGHVKTSGGNISAAIASANGPLGFTTSAGNISISLPRSIQANIEVHGTKASIEDVFNFSGTKTNGKIAGKINGGGVPITANCGYGNVAVKAHD